MIILDAYAVLAFLKAEPAARGVARLLGSHEGRLTALGVAEVLDHLIRIVGVDEDEAVLDIGELGLADPLALTPVTAAAAGRLRARRYHRTRCAVSLADCVAAEEARRLGVPLATADPHLLDVCHSEGIMPYVLVGSSGSTWSPHRG